MVVCNPEGSASQRSLIPEIITVEYLKLFELRLIQSRGHREGDTARAPLGEGTVSKTCGLL